MKSGRRRRCNVACRYCGTDPKHNLDRAGWLALPVLALMIALTVALNAVL